MKNKIRVKLPDANVEYTFKFADKFGNFYTLTYVFAGVSPAGRILVMNVKTRRFTDFSAGKFANMLKAQLISKKAIAEGATSASTDKPLAHVNAPVADDKGDSIEWRMINKLRSCSTSEAYLVHTAICRHPNDLADELERFLFDNTEYTQAYTNRVFQEYMTASDVIDKARNKNASIAKSF